MRCACIDIGSNTTRLLVADRIPQGLERIHEQRVFTHIGRDVRGAGAISQTKVQQVVGVVAAQVERALELGAVQMKAVATAAIRRAANGLALVEAVREACGLQVEILSPEREARLAFTGAAASLSKATEGELGVVDVGGGSSELAVGTAPDQVSWFASVTVGSSDLAHAWLASDPPSARELAAARDHVATAFGGLAAPRPTEAVAVGGSAASLSRLAGALLDASAFARSLRVLTEQPAHAVAAQFGLEIERVRLLPAGLLVLQAASECLGSPLIVVNGGLREGVLLEYGHD